MPSIAYTILGWVAVAILMPSAWIQVWKNCRGPSMEGVSFWSYLCLWLGMTLLSIVAWGQNASFVIKMQFFSAAIGSGVVLFQMWRHHPHRHVFHKYLMRNHHKEFMKEKHDDII